ncbi:E3 ubiquitin-protein ligase RNF170-like [Triticum urartu]|uniref:E3 ubiquitin-protein ligase RNF170 n=1 Tax=Triticum urartu TaxID=4572 RepID=A0A8R7U2H0_TRIUA|nr:E3 ubiquitin-protein ligase RNF170-like [Triticum urartu]XP_048568779.1 E3 ubiquitin-protein ligase RNF170-like [Triticum urartu]
MLPEVSRGRRRPEMAPASAPASAAPPVGAHCAVCRGVDISVPHQANCSHWFCGHCIVGVWLQGSVLRPSNCPVCRRPITLLVPSEVASLLRDEPEIAPVMNRIQQYNGRFAGVPHSMIQWLLDQPFYMRRMLAEFRDTRQEPPSSFKIQVALAATLALVYLASPIDLFPEAFLGCRGLLDDILVLIVAYAFICAAYRDILVARHAV